MSSVGQIQIQAANNSANSAVAKSGPTPGGSASSAGFEAYMAALDQSRMARLDARASSDKYSSPKSQLAFTNRQILPIVQKDTQNPANNSDPMQLLMAQLAAQGLLTQNGQGQNLQNALNIPQASGDLQIADIQKLMASLSGQAATAQDVLGLTGQQLDPKQLSLISEALSKAMRANGQAPNAAMQTQAANLLQALVANTQNQTSGQTPAQIASAIQSLAQKNGVTLPADLQSQLTDMINKGSAEKAGLGSIKLIGVQGEAQAKAAATDPNAAIDPARAQTIQNLTERNLPQSFTSAADKLQKGKGQESLLVPTNLVEKSSMPKVQAIFDANLNSVKTQNDASKIVQSEFEAMKVKLGEGETPKLKPVDLEVTSSQQDLNTLTAATNGNLAKVDAHLASNAQKVEIKASEVSLASGPLHNEVMSAAKSGGGRIMLELTPPEQGTIRIDLRISQSGQAHLIVEGASDATKSRLDQGGQSLKNEFAQMGLNLSLDLRQGNQSQQARDQAFANPRQTFYTNNTTLSQGLSSTLALSSVGSGDNRGNSSTVHLYA
jgi:hypothetical protein